MDGSYPYANGNLLDTPNTYFYTPYEGKDFLDAFRKQRMHVHSQLGGEAAPPKNSVHATGDTLDVAGLLEAGYGTMKKEAIDRLMKKYGPSLRTLKNLTLYLRAAEVFEQAYTQFGELPYINILLKLQDTLCAHHNELKSEEKKRLGRLISRELLHIESLAKKNGVSL